MKKLLLTLLITPGIAMALQGPNAHFDTDQAEVINELNIKEFVTSLPANSRVRIYCHTDVRASVDHNTKLAKRRCDAVLDIISSYSIPVKSYLVVGESSPLASADVPRTTDVHGRHGINRRVEIHYDIEQAQVIKKSLSRHNLRIYAGYAPSGLDPAKLIAPKTYRIDEDWDVEFGLGYSFRFWKNFGIGLSAFTNKSAFGTIELNW